MTSIRGIPARSAVRANARSTTRARSILAGISFAVGSLRQVRCPSGCGLTDRISSFFRPASRGGPSRSMSRSPSARARKRKRARGSKASAAKHVDLCCCNRTANGRPMDRRISCATWSSASPAPTIHGGSQGRSRRPNLPNQDPCVAFSIPIARPYLATHL